jgi:hypothetical protein
METSLKEAISGKGEPAFRDALDMVKEGVILEALYSKDISQRFEDVQKEQHGTFEWIFTDPVKAKRLGSHFFIGCGVNRGHSTLQENQDPESRR